jgi:serine/threonine-protein kinase
MPSPSLLQRLKERKLVQWALAYLAGAWVIYEAVDTIGDRWGITETFFQGLFVVLAIGFFITLVLAWYHGEKGRQRVSGPELLMVAALLVIAGGVLSILGRDSRPVWLEDQPTGGEAESAAAVLNRMPGIAVLPFENRSGLADDEYFSDGIQDELLTRLSRVRGLRVPSRTSSNEFQDIEGRVIPEIGRELQVDYVLEGSVQRAGDRVRINVQLIDAMTEDHLWADLYDRVLTTENLFDIQSEIVYTVASHLDLELREAERLRAARRSTADLEAYELYLRGIDLGYETEEGLSLFQEAVERDPGFVSAQALLAICHAYQYQMFGLRGQERAATARAAAERAVELAPESEDAKLAMGIYLYRVEKEYEAALDWLSQASGTLLGEYEYHRYRALAERRMGRWRESLASFEACQSLSPRDWRCPIEAGRTYLQMRRYADAEEALDKAQRFLDVPVADFGNLTWFRDGTTDGWRPYLERYPDGRVAWEIAMTEGRHEHAAALLENIPDVIPGQRSWFPKALLEAETLKALGQHEAARQEYQRAANILEPLVEEAPDDHRYHASLAWAYAGLGMREEAVREGQGAVEIMPRDRDALDGPHLLFALAAVHARLGEVAESLEVLEDLLSAPSRFAPNMLETHFRLRPIQDDPRFKALMDRERDRVF